jgi:signal peptidase I
MTLDQPWKIAALIGLLAFLRIVWGLWRRAPARTFTLELLDSGLIAFVLVFLLIRPWVVQAFYIPSASMQPTLMGPRDPLSDMEEGAGRVMRRSRQGDRILVNKFVYRLTPAQRGDIIVFRAPPQAFYGNDRRDFVKRLIGLPGDVIRIRRGEGVYVNGRRVVEPLEIPLPDYDWPVDDYGLPTGEGYRVPENCYFVLGDNRNHSMDSHRWTDPTTGEPRPELEAWRVLGKALVIFWPPTRIRLVGDNRQVRLQESTEVVSGKLAPAEAGLR